MIFGIITLPLAGQFTRQAQTEAFEDYNAGRIVDQKDFDPAVLRQGDTLISARLLPLADSPEALAALYDQIWRSDATLLILDGGAEYKGAEDFPRLMADWSTKKRGKQTENARAARKPTKPGPRKLQSKEARTQFSREWRSNVTTADLAHSYGVAKSTVHRWAKFLRLGERGK